jgi:predicted ferric reductase
MLTAILHFVFILANTPIASGYFFDYILPNSVNSILFGQIAFWGFIALVAVSVWIKLPYSLWLWTHKVIGVAFLLSGFHVWLIQPAYAKFDIYHTVFTVVWVLGMISWIYKLFLYKFFAPHHNSVVTKVEQVGDVVNLFLQVKGGRFASRPGDFVFISLVKSSSKLSKENHPFSISGLYDGNVIRLSIKDLGDYTHIVSTIQPGDEVIVYGPYGKFDDKLFAKKSDMVWIGGGIGIAPFAYMAQYFSYLPASGAEGKRKALLFHTVKTPDEALYADEFEAAHQKDADFTYQLWDHSKTGFLTAAAIIEAVGGKENLTNRLIFMCGPLPMMHALSKQFLALGMHPRQIVFEEFTFG